jgi:tetratricopeptide (TPR) repeat protein
MATVCNYHPTQKAHWVCPSCEANFCPDCVDNRVVDQHGKKKVYHFCPECNVEVERAAFEDIVEPFWFRIPKFFIYPFHPQSLILLVVLSFLSVLLIFPSLLSLLIQIFIAGLVLKYAFTALKNTANGNFDPPKINSKTLLEDFLIVFKQLAIFIIIGYAFYKVTQMAGIIIGLSFLGFALLSVPAMIIVLVGSNSLLQAINPALFVVMAWRIGWSYLLMYIFLILLLLAPAFLGQYIVGYLPVKLHYFLLKLAQNYYTLISYHLMGYVIFQYHEEIGYEVDFEEEEPLPEEIPTGEDASGQLLTRVDMLIKEGKLDEAISLIKRETLGAITALGLAERYYNLLRLKEQTSDMLKHGREYLDLLAKVNRKAKLVEVYLECISKDPNFTATPTTLLKAASYLNEAGKHTESLEAYSRFIKTNPEDPLVPKAYFLASNIFNEKLKNPGKATKILKNLIQKYPNHDIIPHVQRYLREIKVPS